MKRAIWLGVVAGVILVTLTGCGKDAPEDQYLNTLDKAAGDLGFTWTKQVQDQALDLGNTICKDRGKGATREETYVAVHNDQPKVNQFNHAAVDAAWLYLCPAK